MPSDPASREVSLDERQLDALREVANIGCGHAANALSCLIGGQKVKIEVPRASVIDLGSVAYLEGGPEQPVVGIATDISGGLSGQVLLLMSHDAGHRLAGVLLGKGFAVTGDLAEEVRSALCEVGNILGSACLSAIARAFSLRLVHRFPGSPRTWQPKWSTR
jgi:chemotaxis protein CheC